ncbi:hypothetical protein AGMMS50268_10050 [Spirochaetia bacterium]|nr:hypothetical protein AGMMS50268_10050 [Spirochaetia bacterium]
MEPKPSGLSREGSPLSAGQWDADLGSGVYKKRVSRPGGGKSGGYRAIIFFRSGERTFYQYAYPKSARDNINDKELLFFRKLAKRYLSMTESQLKEVVDSGEFIEIQEG